MGTNAKLRIAAGVVLAIGLLAFISGNTSLGVILILLGGLGIVYVMRLAPDGGGTPKKKKGAKSKLDTAIEATRTGGATTATPPRTGGAGGLPTWNPTALDTWSPPSLSEREDTTEDSASSSEWDTWGSWESADSGDSGDDTDVLTQEDRNPLDDLDSLDDVDPIAEVERLDSLEPPYDPFDRLDIVEDLDAVDDSVVVDELDELDDFDFEDDFDETVLVDEPAITKKPSGGFSFSSAPAVIKEEEIKTADDIMAASQATELAVPIAEGGDSELARLLAKVQARLSAYE